MLSKFKTVQTTVSTEGKTFVASKSKGRKAIAANSVAGDDDEEVAVVTNRKTVVPVDSDPDMEDMSISFADRIKLKLNVSKGASAPPAAVENLSSSVSRIKLTEVPKQPKTKLQTAKSAAPKKTAKKKPTRVESDTGSEMSTSESEEAVVVTKRAPARAARARVAAYVVEGSGSEAESDFDPAFEDDVDEDDDFSD